MADVLLIQMSGCPGAGKSTLSREIGREIGAVVLDHDVLKTSLLDSGLSFQEAGRVAYDMNWTIVRALLEQGVSVIIDSPCYYDIILENGQNIARNLNARYRYIECVTSDIDVLNERIKSRPRLRSQRRAINLASEDMKEVDEKVTGEPLFREWIANMKRPTHAYLCVDTQRPIAECLAKIDTFLKDQRGEASSNNPVH